MSERAGMLDASRPRVAVVIPTLNEVESIAKVVSAISRDVVARVIVADGGSTDGTIEAARAAGADVVLPGRGYGRACLEGARAAESCDIVVFMDGDGADDPQMIRPLVDLVAGGRWDFAIGSRTRGAREPGAMAWHQALAGRLVGLLTALLYGTRYTDMCVLRALRRDALLALPMTEMTYGWNLEMQMLVARAGWRCVEIPVPCRRRIGGRSKVAGTISGSLVAGAMIVRAFVRVALRPAPRPRGTA